MGRRLPAARSLRDSRALKAGCQQSYLPCAALRHSRGGQNQENCQGSSERTHLPGISLRYAPAGEPSM